ncbi:MAG: hypothetical protein KAT15_13445, partial [Bacteroidales bacterium]|nr:hypothetical protein [Bacteroidales bacterium]
MKIKDIKLIHPGPATPFYHFRAELELPDPSIIEVEAYVDGKILRFTNLYKGDKAEEKGKPALIHRPPSGYGLSHDNILYESPVVVGWLKWQPGRSYNIKIIVRLKKGADRSEEDVFLSDSRIVTAPETSGVYDQAWKNYKSVVLSETAGIARSAEPVELLLAFYPDEAKHLKREIRVVAVDPSTYELSEVPSQVYDIQKFLEEDDLAPDDNGNPTRQVPLWLPTITARVAFLADVPAKSSRVFLIYYNNENAMAKMYKTSLRVQGEAPGLQIDNDIFSVVLHPASGHLDQITLKNMPDASLFHRMETNGAIHWNPGIYTPPKPWTHTADWKPPKNIKNISGPVIATSDVWDNLRGVPEVEASVRYEFYPGKPYFISSTS